MVEDNLETKIKDAPVILPKKSFNKLRNFAIYGSISSVAYPVVYTTIQGAINGPDSIFTAALESLAIVGVLDAALLTATYVFLRKYDKN